MPRRKYSYIHQDLQKLARPIEELTPDPKNARTHGDRNMSAIRGSLKEFGFRGAIIAQKSGDELIKFINVMTMDPVSSLTVWCLLF